MATHRINYHGDLSIRPIVMKYENCQHYILSKPESVEEYPFGPQAAVFKVHNKMFALLTINKGVGNMNLKCDPDEAQILRDVFEAVTPGYHMNKRHWNTIILNGTIPADEIERMIDNSYKLVVKGLKRADRERLQLLYGE